MMGWPLIISDGQTQPNPDGSAQKGDSSDGWSKPTPDESAQGDDRSDGQTYTVEERAEANKLFYRILQRVTGTTNPDLETISKTEHSLDEEKVGDCFETLIHKFHRSCITQDDNRHAMYLTEKFAQLCSSKYSPEDVLQAISVECMNH